MIYIQQDDSMSFEIQEDMLIKAVETTLREAGVPGKADSLQLVDLSLILGDDDLLRGMNQQYRGIDTSTDVLSFEDGEIDPDSGLPYLGDIIISVQRAQSQVVAAGHNLVDELQLLVVHGVLHLLGYDHADDAQKAEMWAMQDLILTELNCSARPVE